jgi:hypothetical protein
MREQIVERQTEFGAHAKEMVKNGAKIKLLAETGELFESRVSLEEARDLAGHWI